MRQVLVPRALLGLLESGPDLPGVYNELKKRNLETFLSEHGTTLRINRSIQVEGIFGVVKEDYGFRRLLYRGKEKVKKELLLLSIGFNLQKLHNRNMAGRIGMRLFAQQHTA